MGVALVATLVLCLEVTYTVSTDVSLKEDTERRQVHLINPFRDEQELKPGNIAEISPPWGPHRHDSDRKVPEYKGCFRDVAFAKSKMQWSTYKGTTWQIFYDTCSINAHDPGPYDWMKIKAHERAHTRGFRHYEGYPPTYDGKQEVGENPAYYPVIQICHC